MAGATVPGAFPNYLQLRERGWLPARLWPVLRVASVAAAVATVALLVLVPDLGLKFFWGLAVPVLPALFFVAPGLWRNVCPLAALNQLPRTAGFTRAGRPPEWLLRHGYLVAVGGLLVAVSARKWLFNDSATATAALIVAAMLLAFTGGVLFRGKSGWCSLVCPVLPVERLYNETPFVRVANRHCDPCVGCTKNCYDFNPLAANLSDAYDDDATWAGYRRLLAAIFPGFLIAYFGLSEPTAIGLGAWHLAFALHLAASAGIFFAVATLVRMPPGRLPAIFAVVALNIFYWYVTPLWLANLATLVGVVAPSWLAWLLRAGLLAASVLWLWRGVRKERAFVGRMAEGEGSRLTAGATAALGRAAAGGQEVVFQPQDRRVAVEAGRSLLEIAEANRLPLEAGCRMGMCGADPVLIVAGMEHLPPRGDDENATLARIGLAGNPQARLACMCRVRGPVTVSLAPGSTTGGAAAPAAADAGAAAPRSTAARADATVRALVVVGNGIAGVTAADHARRLHPDCEIHLVGAERHPLYNRMAITRLIYGRSAMAGLALNPESWCEERRITAWLNTSVHAVAPTSRTLVLGTGETLAYDRLVLATGATCLIPPIPGFGIAGSYGLRDADEAMAIREFVQKKACRRAVVAGGGLLGLETAYALHKLGLRVTVLERGPWLLRRQLDARAAALLASYLHGLGIEILFQTEVAALVCDDRVRVATLKSGEDLACEVFVVCAGIVPQVELACRLGLAVGRGIRVDARMATRDAAIFAAGDCAEFDGEIPGLWPTAVEQGRVAGANAVGGDEIYVPQAPCTALKVAGIDVASFGRIDAGEGETEVVREDEATRRYRKFVLREGRLAGAILIGCPEWSLGVQRALKGGRDLGALAGQLAGDDPAVFG